MAACTTPFCGSFYSDWTTLSLAASMISVLFSVLFILIARLFGLTNFEQTAKAELSFAASTFLLVVMLLSIINFVEPRLADERNGLARCLYLSAFNLPCHGTVPAGTSLGLTPGVSLDQYSVTINSRGERPQTLIDWTKIYMQTPASCVQTFMTSLYYLSIPIETGASIYEEIFMSEGASGFGWKWIAERINTAASSLSFFMYVFYLLVHTLNFIQSFAGFFFSIGVVLRAFPPTRGAGAYIMALVFGLYFIFPLSYLLVATMSLPHAQANTLSLTTSTSGSFTYLCQVPANPGSEYLGCQSPSVTRAFEVGDQIRANRARLEDLLTFRFNDLSRHLASVICIFPLISFVILMTFVLNATTLLGGQIPEVGRGLVKLI